jgi:transposase
MMLSEGQMNDRKGVNMLAPLLPPARELTADRGYDSNPFRTALAERGIDACIPPKSNGYRFNGDETWLRRVPETAAETDQNVIKQPGKVAERGDRRGHLD